MFATQPQTAESTANSHQQISNSLKVNTPLESRDFSKMGPDTSIRARIDLIKSYTHNLLSAGDQTQSVLEKNQLQFTKLLNPAVTKSPHALPFTPQGPVTLTRAKLQTSPSISDTTFVTSLLPKPYLTSPKATQMVTIRFLRSQSFQFDLSEWL